MTWITPFFRTRRARPTLACLAAVVAATAVDAASLAQESAPAEPGRRDPTIPSEALRPFVQPGRTPGVQPSPGGERRIQPGDAGRFAEVRLVGVPLALAAAEIGAAGNANVVVSEDVAAKPVTLTLRDIDLPGVLSAIAVSHGLVVRRDEKSGVHVLMSPQGAVPDLSAFRTDKTEVFTLLYPNALDVARAIRDLFGDRVVVSLGEGNGDLREDLEERFDRFDLLQQRGTGIGGTVSGGTRVSGGGSSNEGRSRFRSPDRAAIARAIPSRTIDRDQSPITPEQARALNEELAATVDPAHGGGGFAARLATRDAITYVTVLRRLNRIVVRSADQRIVSDIRALIERLDVPTPLVLLEIRVLRVDLSDGVESAFDAAFQAGDASGLFSTGVIGPTPEGGTFPTGTGFNARAGVFQVVSDNFQARLQLLQSKGKVTALATPLILTANAEVSRIFSGESVPIVVGFTEPQVITSNGAQTILSAVPVTELRDVGTSLLITANINADRTTTLRLLQETSTVNTNGATILVPAGTTFQPQPVDTIQRQVASGTIVAADGRLLAFGGLIEEAQIDRREGWPVLGDIPLIGLLFRRQDTVTTRRELIILVRPYVLNTPVEGDAISRDLLRTLSIHPYRPGEAGDLGTFRSGEDGPGTGVERSLIEGFRFHNTPGSPGGTR